MIKGGLLATSCVICLLLSSCGSSANGGAATIGRSYCRYDIDVSRRPDARFVIGHLRGQRYTTCPFLDEQSEPVRIYVEDRGSGACANKPIGGLSSLRISAITKRENDEALASCFPIKPPENEATAPGKVYLLSAPSADDPRSEDLMDIAIREVALAGLPVSYLDTRGHNGTTYACFEMMSGANIDPLAFIRSNVAKMPSPVAEKENPAPTCHLAFAALGLES